MKSKQTDLKYDGNRKLEEKKKKKVTEDSKWCLNLLEFSCYAFFFAFAFVFLLALDVDAGVEEEEPAAVPVLVLT